MTSRFFEEVSDALAGFLPPKLRDFSSRLGAQTVKVWYGEDAHEHYEVQLVAASALRAGGIKGAKAPALEIGFHAEHADAARNASAIEALRERERTWRRALGAAPESGRFVGRQREWMRLSELWDGGDITNTEAAIEAADRLAAYIRALEPVRARSRRRQ